MRILIVKPSSLGDIICALPVAQSIRDQLPEAEISWVVKSRFADVVRRCPTVNGELIEFEHSAGWSGITAIWRVMRRLRERQFDAVLDFQGLLRSGLMTFAANAPFKVGIAEAREGSRLFYNRRQGRQLRPQLLQLLGLAWAQALERAEHGAGRARVFGP